MRVLNHGEYSRKAALVMDAGVVGLSQISGVDGSSGAGGNFALRFGGTS